MMDALKDLFKSDEQFRLEQQSILGKVEADCKRLRDVANSLPDGEQKVKFIEEADQLHESVRAFQAELA
jgi:hypothetical protein